MKMDRASLVLALQTSLQDAAARLDDPSDLERLLDLAAMDMGRVRPRTKLGSIDLVADVADYAAPSDLLAIETVLWGMDARRDSSPWESDWPQQLPRMVKVETTDGRRVMLVPTPTATQIAALGAECKFYYTAGHSIADAAADTSILPEDAWLLLLRAQAEAMKELSLRGSTKPVRLRDGQTQGARNGTPAALFRQFMEEFDRQARR